MNEHVSNFLLLKQWTCLCNQFKHIWPILAPPFVFIPVSALTIIYEVFLLLFQIP